VSGFPVGDPSVLAHVRGIGPNPDLSTAQGRPWSLVTAVLVVLIAAGVTFHA